MPRKSAEQLAMEATFPPELPSSVAPPKPPAFLDEAEAAIWSRIVDSKPPGHFTPAACAMLAAYCSASVLYQEARDLVKRDGNVLLDHRGRAYAHPATRIMKAQAATLAQLAQKLRLTPVSR